MFQVQSMRIATLAALGVLLVLWGGARAEQERQEDAAVTLEVKVLEVQVTPGQGERDAVLYRLEVISVLRSTAQVTPGDTLVVRADALSQEALDRGLVGPRILAPGWLGVASLNPDPKASGPEAHRQFTMAANGDSFEDLPPGPPAVKWTQ